jgi:hypothetical protein
LHQHLKQIGINPSHVLRELLHAPSKSPLSPA